MNDLYDNMAEIKEAQKRNSSAIGSFDWSYGEFSPQDLTAMFALTVAPKELADGSTATTHGVGQAFIHARCP